MVSDRAYTPPVPNGLLVAQRRLAGLDSLEQENERDQAQRDHGEHPESIDVSEGLGLHLKTRVDPRVSLMHRVRRA